MIKDYKDWSEVYWRYKLFVDEYFKQGPNRFNATAAYSAIYPKAKRTAAQTESAKILASPIIKAEVARRLKELQIGAEEALIMMADFAKSDMGDYLDVGSGGVELSLIDKNGNLKNTRAIKRFKSRVTQRGVVTNEIELYSAADAVDKLLRVHRLYDDGRRKGDEEEKQLCMIPAGMIASDFVNSHLAVESGQYTEFLEYGGRGSTKSSYFSLEFIKLLINNPLYHGLAMRQVANTLYKSVYQQLEWAIRELGYYDKFKFTLNPMEITYLPTRQKIYFQGADDPLKIKSIKTPFGAISLLWFEELPEFHGEDQIRNITQSAIRGTDEAYIFKSWNPPRTTGNWVNKYLLIPKEKQFRHMSDYTTVPVSWLGRVFLDEAEHLKNTNLAAYEHEYLGVVNGMGDMVFENLEIRKIMDDEIYGTIDEYTLRVGGFDNILHGLDFGYYPHPAHYTRCHYDATRHVLYIFGEVRKWKTSNRELYDALVEYGMTNANLLICDSAEPKSVDDFRDYGANARGAEKGAESVKYSIKWLQSLAKIVIDPARCPYTVEEMTDYAYERTKDGEIIEAYPREKDDAIAAIRYATNLIWRQRGK